MTLCLSLTVQCRVISAQGKLPCAETTATGLERSKDKTKDRRFAVDGGAWSGAAISLFNTWNLFDTNPGRDACFYSPDKKKKVVIDNEKVSIFIGDRRFETNFGDFPNAELGWAPDSSRLFITWTDGGEEGQWRTYVYDVTPRGLILLTGVEDKAREDFEKVIRRLPIDPEMNNKKLRYLWDSAQYCEPYNVVGAQWLNGSSELLVSVLTINVPARCRYGGDFDVYRIAVPSGNILARYTAGEAYKKFNRANLPLITK